jgi:hypothetical protein
MNLRIRTNDDFSDIPVPVRLTDNEFAYDIWRFKIVYQKKVYITGLYLNGAIKKIESMGFYKKLLNSSYKFIRDIDNIIEEVKLADIKHELFLHVSSLINGIDFEYQGYDVTFPIEKLLEIILKQDAFVFTKPFLEHLEVHDKPILKDTKYTSYFFFENRIITVTKKGVSSKAYDALDYCCIWKDQIIQRNFKYNLEEPDCHFKQFIFNVINEEKDRFNSITSAIGYLLHNFTHPSTGQAIILYDEEITDWNNPMGGTGKGLFANAIKQIRKVVKIDGKKFDERDKFRFQDINESTQVVWLDDVKPELGFETFHSALTDGWTIEKKFKDQLYIQPQDSPKLLICSNSVLSRAGTTNIRRQFIIEFSNHYSKQIVTGVEEPIKNEHGCIFFDDDYWDAEEWNNFFSFLIDCACLYHKNGLVYYEHRNLNRNILLQATCVEFVEWLTSQELKENAQYNTKELYLDFRDTYFGEGSAFKQRTFSNFLKKYGESIGLEYTVVKSNGTSFFVLKK